MRLNSFKKSVWFFLFVALVFSTSCSGNDDDDNNSVSDDDTGGAGDDTGGDDTADDDAADDTSDDSADDTQSDDDTGTPAPEDIPIYDENGRRIVLHGANYMGMEFGWFNHQPEDFERMASWGFNVVRLPIAWNYLEPQQGVWDESYLTDVVGPTVQYAHEAGLRVIVDMHQWQWCPPCNRNGIPSWTCEDFGSMSFPWDILFASHDFWNHPEYLDDFVTAWDKVAEFFEDDDAIWAFDLFNEPWAGFRTLPWTSENPLIRPLYIRFIDAIRARMPNVKILVEPAMAHNTGFPFVMDPLPYENVIFAPHLYPGTTASDSTGYVFPKSLIEWMSQKLKDEAAAFGTPLIVGEAGIPSNAHRA